MRGLYTIPKLNEDILDVAKLLPIQDNIDPQPINSRLVESVETFIIAFYPKKNFSAGKTKKDFEAISDHLAKIDQILKNNHGIEDYFILKSPKLRQDDSELYDEHWCSVYSMLNNIDESCRIFDFYCKTFIATSGRYKDIALSFNKIKDQFTKLLADIYTSATGKKPTPKGGGSKTDSDFVKFAKTVLNYINTEYPELEEGHNISISFDAIVRRWAKSSKK